MSIKGKIKSAAQRLGIWGIVVILICTLIGAFAGFLITKWSTADTQKAYLQRLLMNAKSELKYNLDITWYNDEKYIEGSSYFSSLRTDALWELYYNCEMIFPKRHSEIDNILNCINEIDWINRKASSQTTVPAILQMAISQTAEADKKQLENLISLNLSVISSLHKEMYDKYQKSVKPLMIRVKQYLSEASADLE